MELIEVLIPVGIIALGYARKDIFLYIMSGMAAGELGLSWYSEYHTWSGMVIALALGGIALYSIFKAIENMLDRGE